jgi:hypothetical protein
VDVGTRTWKQDDPGKKIVTLYLEDWRALAAHDVEFNAFDLASHPEA